MHMCYLELSPAIDTLLLTKNFCVSIVVVARGYIAALAFVTGQRPVGLNLDCEMQLTDYPGGFIAVDSIPASLLPQVVGDEYEVLLASTNLMGIRCSGKGLCLDNANVIAYTDFNGQPTRMMELDKKAQNLNLDKVFHWEAPYYSSFAAPHATWQRLPPGTSTEPHHFEITRSCQQQDGSTQVSTQRHLIHSVAPNQLMLNV